MGIQAVANVISGEWDEAAMRAITFPEEDRHLFTTAVWRGEYRWFRSPDVTPIEWYRRGRKVEQDKRGL